MRSIRYLLLSGAFAGALSAQPVVEERHADIRGGRGDHGKCTAEVDVEGAAEVEIYGDTGVLRTLSGKPAHWKRFECTGPMPGNPREFRFHGVDGRGRQEIIREPRSNNGVAVVRLDDPRRGREAYTFDIEWRGGERNERSYLPPPSGE